MSKPRPNPLSQADKARRADSPWRGQAIKRGTPRGKPGVSAGYTDNAQRNRQAVKKLSLSELQTGRSDADWTAWHEANRASVRARFGKRAG